MRSKLLISLIFLAFTLAPPSHATSSKGIVVLLHGIARSNRSMQPLEVYLSRQGYEVLNIDYPSTSHTLNELADMIAAHITRKTKGSDAPLYMVGHSMGGVLIRLIASRHRKLSIAAAVQLGSPNQGSQLASKLKPYWLYRKIYGPAGQQLATENFPLIYPADFPIGVIAGNRSIDPISSLMLKGDDDGKVLISETQLFNVTDWLLLPVNHATMMQNNEVMCQVNQFLEHQSFDTSGACH